MMKKLAHVFTLSVIFTIAACVTINVYFPAAAAEKAADRIIREVWEVPPRPAAPPVPQSSSGRRQQFARQALALQERFARFFTSLFLVAPAYAQADLTIATPAINKLTASMKARHPQLAPYYSSGAVGLTTNAQVAIRNAKALPLKDRNRVKKLVSDENADRSALYREIAKANKHPEWEANIRATFARRWLANARSGWWYQNANQVWQQK